MDQLRYRIRKITTHKFETFDFAYTPADKVRLEMEIDYRNPETHFIEVIANFKFLFENSKETIVNISVGVTYDIHPEDFAAMADADGAVTIPHSGAILLSGLVIGTTRGVLSVRTENTKFSEFIIPPTTLTNTIQGDVKITHPAIVSA